MTVSIPPSYFTPLQTVGEVNYDDGIVTVILNHSPRGQGGTQLWIYPKIWWYPVFIREIYQAIHIRNTWNYFKQWVNYRLTSPLICLNTTLTLEIKQVCKVILSQLGSVIINSGNKAFRLVVQSSFVFASRNCD